jgi:Flp pilus assembly protein TadD
MAVSAPIVGDRVAPSDAYNVSFKPLAVTVFACLWFAASVSDAAEVRPSSKRPTAPADEVGADESLKGLPESMRAERTLARKPKDRTAHLQAARAHLAEGAEIGSKVEAAQAHALAVLEDSPNDIEARLIAGQTSLLRGEIAAAVRHYQAAALADPKNASAVLGLGDALSRLGDEAGSTQAFAKYRELKGMPPLQPAVKKN